MTYEDDYSIPEEILEQICEDGFTDVAGFSVDIVNNGFCYLQAAECTFLDS